MIARASAFLIRNSLMTNPKTFIPSCSVNTKGDFHLIIGKFPALTWWHDGIFKLISPDPSDIFNILLMTLPCELYVHTGRRAVVNQLELLMQIFLSSAIRRSQSPYDRQKVVTTILTYKFFNSSCKEVTKLLLLRINNRANNLLLMLAV